VDPGASSGNGTPIYIRFRSLTRCVKCVIIQTMKKDFLDTVIEEQKILDIGLKQSKANKKERLDKEKSKRFPTAEERWPRRGIVIKND
jgi:hypothetical protein